MEGNQVGTITKFAAPKKDKFFTKKDLLKGGASLLGGAAAAGIGALMGAPSAAGALFGVKGARAGRDLLSKGSGIFKRLNPDAKPMKVKKPKATQIKTAKPTPVNVDKAERQEVLSKYYGVGGFKPGATSLKPKADALSAGKIKGPAKRKATMAGKKYAPKNPGAVMYNYPGKVKEEIEKDTALKLFR